jgi:hypothetical protein
MARLESFGLVGLPVPLSGDFSTGPHVSASPARVAGWHQERRAVATRDAPPGVRQGGPWGSKT